MEAPKLSIKLKLKPPSTAPQQGINPSSSSNTASQSLNIPSTANTSKKKRTISDSPKQSKKRKTHLSVCLQKLITLFRQKDTYGFFLNPVDAEVVPDYRKIIAKPMDLGTMKEKVAKRKYKSIEEFESDFRLVISNAQTYNQRETVYYKNAERLKVYGIKLIEKEIPGIIPDPEVDQSFDDLPSVSTAPKIPKISKFVAVSSEIPSIQAPKEEEFKRRQAKKIKHCDDLENMEFEKYNPDGSLYIDPEKEVEPAIQPSTPFALFANSYPRHCLNGLNIQEFDAHSYWHTGSNRDYSQVYSTHDTEAIYVTYGDLRCQTYAQSIENFTRGLDLDSLGITQRISHFTRGAHEVVKKTRELIAKDPSAPPVELDGMMEFECGKTDIGKRIEFCNGYEDRQAERAEAEALRKQAAANAHCLAPTAPEQDPPLQVSPVLFEQVRNDLGALFNNPNDLSRTETLESIRKKLWVLSVYSRDPELNFNKPQLNANNN